MHKKRKKGKMKDGHCNGEIVLEFLSVRKIL